MNNTITVLLAEDHVVVREGLRVLIEADGDIKVVGEAITGREAVVMTKQLRPDVVVMDIAMPLMNGIQATHQILDGSSKSQGSGFIGSCRSRICGSVDGPRCGGLSHQTDSR